MLAATGDHKWRKLYGEADDTELTGNPTWRGGPLVELPELLRSTGRTGARGRAPAARDDSAAREAVLAARERRMAEHSAAVTEVLAASPGEPLSPRAAQVALASLMAAVRTGATPGRRDRRTATRDGLACTLFFTGDGTGRVSAPTWRILLPGRIPVFHLPGRWVPAPRAAVPDDAPTAEYELVANVASRPTGDVARHIRSGAA
jgi:hypothetical protein